MRVQGRDWHRVSGRPLQASELSTRRAAPVELGRLFDSLGEG